jgi:CRISPR-associated endonuclease/helicase Cas3
MTTDCNFDTAFEKLTGNLPFPWQQVLYARFAAGDIPDACTLPTGLGKTSVIAVWLIALANGKPVPRRLVYVVNRRTVVDQTTDEAEKYRRPLKDNGPPWHPILLDLSDRLRALSSDPSAVPLALSTLRGQFADNREWSADPSRPAIIAGTVDMIGSRLLFSGYGVGFKSKPLHAGFLGQDVLLVHDEAHLEPAFQDLIVAIRKEQEQCKEFGTFRVMELTATSRGGGEVFALTDQDLQNSTVKERVEAKKAIYLHDLKDVKKLAEQLTERAKTFEDKNRAVLVFTRTVEDVMKVADKLPKGRVITLTGTMRGKERDDLVADPIFKRFLPGGQSDEPTTYLVCTSAGEVGVNISADHLVCDLSTFESMAQRLGRVNRFGKRDDTEIHVVHPTSFEDKDYELRQSRTLALLRELKGDGSPAAISELNADARLAAFAPTPTILPTSDILFDAWALTTIRDKLPGRPKVEPYLHGIAGWEPPETHVAWREEVERITGEMLKENEPEDLLDDYPLKPHELLKDNSSRVYDRLKKLKAAPDTPVWVVADDDSVTVTALGELIEAGKEEIEHATILLPPSAGGLTGGMLNSGSDTANDVADDWVDEKKQRRRVRVWDEDPVPDGMRPIRTIDTRPDADEAEPDEAPAKRFWRWFELQTEGDTDGSKANKLPVLWCVHVGDVVKNATDIVSRLPLPDSLKEAVIFAARFHDHGKRRKLFQTVLGNFNPNRLLAKSGKRGGRVTELYRHEFGSLVDLEAEPEFQVIADDDQKELIRHLIAVHHGRGRPHFPADEAFDPEHGGTETIAAEVPRRFARLQRKYGRWGLAYLESLLRAADYAASAKPSAFVTEGES